MKIPTKRVINTRLKEVDFNNLEFGKYVSDHMLICDYDDSQWKLPQLLPYSDLRLSPATLALHYGQTVFEGMKAFRMNDGRVNIFRIDKHYERLVKSLDRMCMPIIPREIFIEGLIQLVQLDKCWVPGEEGSSLYLRPFMFASESWYGVKISEQYRFVIFTGPVPALYSRSIKVKIESHYARAGRGGTGFAKCGGNYGAAFLPTRNAKDEGYDQVLWTDAAEHKYIEESGMMNVMFVIENKLITPALSDSILDGVTRDSLLILASDSGIPIEERLVSISEIKQALCDNSISAAFGTGTAAVVVPISSINIEGIDHQLPQYEKSNTIFILKKKLEAIRNGSAPDDHGWNTILE